MAKRLADIGAGIGLGIGLGIVLLGATLASAHAGIKKIERSAAECQIKPLSTAEPEWQQSAESLSGLIKTGAYDIRQAYRYKACGSEFTIYVLQGTTDRSAVYECTSDDTYRPVFPCFKLGKER